MDKWVAEAQKHGGEKAPIVVVGGKADLSGRRFMPKESLGSDFMKKDYQGYYEVSAKDNSGYEELLTALKRLLKENI